MPVAYDHHKGIPDIPKKYNLKKAKPKAIAVVDEDGCTGCEACIPFCPVDCIEPVEDGKYPDAIIPPVFVRWDECIGCEICVRVCEKMAWYTISMVPTKEFETEYGVSVSGIDSEKKKAAALAKRKAAAAAKAAEESSE